MKRTEGRRAQSTVIETLLMLLITVVASSLVYGFSLSSFSSQSQGPMVQIQERLVVENVWFTTSGGARTSIKIYVRNIGTVDVRIVNATVNDLAVSFSSSLYLLSQGSGWLNCTYTPGWSSGTSYTIALVSERGSRFVVQEAA